jgi:hypothetical protein
MSQKAQSWHRHENRLSHNVSKPIATIKKSMLGASLAYTSTLKMEVVRSSETSVNFYQTTRRHIPEDSSVHGHRHDSLRVLNASCWFLVGYNYYPEDGGSIFLRNVEKLITVLHEVISQNNG